MPIKVTFYMKSGAKLTLNTNMTAKEFYGKAVAILGNKNANSLTFNNNGDDMVFTIIPRSIWANSVIHIEEVKDANSKGVN